MRKFLLPEASHTYKANLHMHTTLSDGCMTPEETKRAFIEHGYDIVAFTDHEVMIPHPELTDENFLALTSYEVAVNDRRIPEQTWEQAKTVHMNLLAPEASQTYTPIFNQKQLWPAIEHMRASIPDEVLHTDYPLKYENMNEAIRCANEAGFLVALNHPVWSSQDYSDYIQYKGLWAVECHNTGCWQAGYVDTMQPIDDLLRAGEKVYPIATDDAHNIGNCFGGWVMIRAEKLDHKTVFEALRRGDFYCTTGPSIDEISLDGNILRVACSESRRVYVTTEQRHTYFTPIEPGKKITEAEFDMTYYLDLKKDQCGYIRVTVEDAEGFTAHSRAYFVDELK